MSLHLPDDRENRFERVLIRIRLVSAIMVLSENKGGLGNGINKE